MVFWRSWQKSHANPGENVDISWTTFEKNFLFWKAKATTMQHASPATVKCIPTDPKHAFWIHDTDTESSLSCIVLYEAAFSLWPALKDSLVRIIIGLGIEFSFNCLSIFIEMHCCDVPIRRVWFKCWKNHLTANSIIFTAMVFYLTATVLTIYQTRMNDIHLKIYNIRNCTLPFTSLWQE